MLLKPLQLSSLLTTCFCFKRNPLLPLQGVGSHAAHMLLRSGVGKLRLVDFDQVCSELHRLCILQYPDCMQICQQHTHVLVSLQCGKQCHFNEPFTCCSQQINVLASLQLNRVCHPNEPFICCHVHNTEICLC
jgi:hypothetical protein